MYSAMMNPEEIRLRERKQTREHLAFTLLKCYERAKGKTEIPDMSVKEEYEFCYEIA